MGHILHPKYSNEHLLQAGVGVCFEEGRIEKGTGKRCNSVGTFPKQGDPNIDPEIFIFSIWTPKGYP